MSWVLLIPGMITWSHARWCPLPEHDDCSLCCVTLVIRQTATVTRSEKSQQKKYIYRGRFSLGTTWGMMEWNGSLQAKTVKMRFHNRFTQLCIIPTSVIRWIKAFYLQTDRPKCLPRSPTVPIFWVSHFRCPYRKLVHFLGFPAFWNLLSESDSGRHLVRQREASSAAIFYLWTGFIWAECKQVWEEGAKAYVRQWWNWLDFIMLSLYLCTISLRTVAWIQSHDPETYGPNVMARVNWPEGDPTIISEGVFAVANVFSFARIIYLFQANPQLGPLQISLGCMLIDIGKFLFIFFLVLTSFACGLNQLYYYYSPADTVKETTELVLGANGTMTTETDRVTADELYQNSYENAFAPWVWASFSNQKPYWVWESKICFRFKTRWEFLSQFSSCPLWKNHLKTNSAEVGKRTALDKPKFQFPKKSEWTKH